MTPGTPDDAAAPVDAVDGVVVDDAAEPVTEPEPVAAEPVVAEPVVAEPVVAEPVVAEPVVPEPEPVADQQPVEPAPEPEPLDPRLAAAVDVARAAAQEEAGDTPVGEHLGTEEEPGALTHRFDAALPGYRGWHWAVTVAAGGPEHPVTVSEAVLLPGADALVAPTWVPWTDRVRAGDLGVGDLLPTAPGDPRLVPGFLAPDDPSAEPLAPELGLGRARVLGRDARLDLLQRWRDGERGPDTPMAKGAPATCVGCGFYLPLGGLLSAALGACANEMSPADGQVVHAEYGCGAHSEVEVDTGSTVPVAELVYDDSELELVPPLR